MHEVRIHASETLLAYIDPRFCHMNRLSHRTSPIKAGAGSSVASDGDFRDERKGLRRAHCNIVKFKFAPFGPSQYVTSRSLFLVYLLAHSDNYKSEIDSHI